MSGFLVKPDGSNRVWLNFSHSTRSGTPYCRAMEMAVAKLSMSPDTTDSRARRADALVVFGATGDLAHRKIFPALCAMCRRGALKLPVIGMGLLFAVLALRGGPSIELRNTAQNLLQHLSLLFVPAGVGVMLHFRRMADEWLPIVVALIASTFITIAVTALVLRFLHPHEPGQRS